jgi:hypothetical protein
MYQGKNISINDFYREVLVKIPFGRFAPPPSVESFPSVSLHHECSLSVGQWKKKQRTKITTYFCQCQQQDQQNLNCLSQYLRTSAIVSSSGEISWALLKSATAA